MIEFNKSKNKIKIKNIKKVVSINQGEGIKPYLESDMMCGPWATSRSWIVMTHELINMSKMVTAESHRYWYNHRSRQHRLEHGQPWKGNAGESYTIVPESDRTKPVAGYPYNGITVNRDVSCEIGKPIITSGYPKLILELRKNSLNLRKYFIWMMNLTRVAENVAAGVLVNLLEWSVNKMGKWIEDYKVKSDVKETDKRNDKGAAERMEIIIKGAADSDVPMVGETVADVVFKNQDVVIKRAAEVINETEDARRPRVRFSNNQYSQAELGGRAPVEDSASLYSRSEVVG